MSLAGAGQRRYLAGVERRQLDMLGPVSFLSFTIQLDMLGPVSFLSFTIQLDMLGPVSFISFTIQLYVFTIYFLYTLQTILH